MKHLDARKIAGPDKPATFFQTFDELALGETLEIIVDHDPVMLKQKFNSERAKEYTWGYLEEGPDVWRINITKTAGS